MWRGVPIILKRMHNHFCHMFYSHDRVNFSVYTDLVVILDRIREYVDLDTSYCLLYARP